MIVSKLDRNANDDRRVRRNFQRLADMVIVQSINHVNTTGGDAVAGTAAETTIKVGGVTVLFPFPARFFGPGVTVRVRVAFKASNTGTPTLELKAKLGTVIVADTGVITTAALSNSAIIFDFIIAGTTTGATGTVMGNGTFDMGTVPGTFRLNPTATIDTTIVENLTLTVQWGTASGSNTITFEGWEIWKIN